MSDALNTLPPVVGAAFIVSMTMYPADVVRALCMANPGTSAASALTGFVKTHGLVGFVKKGLVAEVTRASFSRTIKFWCQPIVHKALYDKPESKGTPLTKGIAGALATIPEVLVISPFENVKIAQQLDKEGKFNGSAATYNHLVRSNGYVGGLYIGYAGMQMRQMLWTFGYFATLDILKTGTAPIISDPLARDVVSGFGAGVVGVLMNCWTEVVRSIIQKDAIAQTFNPNQVRPNPLAHFNPVPFFQKTSQVIAEKGIASLYSGVLPKCIHLGGSGAILAVLMPRFKEAWTNRQ